jgi:hypothetical protein
MFICGELAIQIHAMKGTYKYHVCWDKSFVISTNNSATDSKYQNV